MKPRQLLVLVVLFLFAIGCASRNRANRDGIMSSELPITVDDLTEIKEGELNHKRILWQYKIYPNTRLQEYCDLILDKIAEVSPRPNLPYHVILLDTPEVNFFGGPGGYIYITKGLFETIRTEGELAGLMAHEVSHVAQYDYSTIPQASKVKTVYNVVLAGSELVKNSGAAGTFGSAANLGISEVGKRAPVVFRRFTADQEVETDERAIDVLVRAGYDPREFEQFIERLARVPIDEVARYVALMNSHPPFESRRKILTKRVSRAPKSNFSLIAFQRTSLLDVQSPVKVDVPEMATAPKPAKSIVFEFRSVEEGPTPEPATSSKQENKINERKRFGSAWF